MRSTAEVTVSLYFSSEVRMGMFSDTTLSISLSPIACKHGPVSTWRGTSRCQTLLSASATASACPQQGMPSWLSHACT